MSGDLILGIDLGTTFSAMAYINPHGKPQIIANAEGKRTTPSVVFFDEDGTVVVGEEARNRALIDPGRTIQFIKRKMGEQSFSLYIDGAEHYPEDISACILKKLRDDAAAVLGTEVRQAVISVPAYFKDSQRRATQIAGEIAGLEVVAIINEPTAAALAYGFGQAGGSQNLLVYDFGGGTFDVTILQVDHNEFTVRATDGDSHLGGIDVDQRLIDYLADQFQKQHGSDLRNDPYTLQELRERAERAKIDLSARQSVVVMIGQGSTIMRVDLTREHLADLVSELLQRTKDCMERVLASANLGWSDIDTMLPVGGSSRMACVREMLKQVSGRELLLNINPDECVALGAALRGTTSGVQEDEDGKQPTIPDSQTTEIVIRDVAPHSLGVKALNAEGRPVNSIIIPRLTEVPCERSRTYAANQQSVEIEVLQGEADDPFSPEVDLIGKVEMRDLPPQLDGEVVIKITLRYDANGVVEVIAEELTGGRVVREQLLRKMGELAPDVLETLKRSLEENTTGDDTAGDLSQQDEIRG